jgi:hypothetical protein
MLTGRDDRPVVGVVSHRLVVTRPGLLAVATTAMAVGAVACGGGVADDGHRAASTPTASVSSGTPRPILIKTRVDIPTGRILAGSTVGGSAFCPGGTVMDKHGTPDIGLVDRTVTCQDGTLRLGLNPQLPVGNTQSGPWRIISGTGAYDRWRGNGRMTITYDAGETDPHPTRGGEIYTGTVTR